MNKTQTATLELSLNQWQDIVKGLQALAGISLGITSASLQLMAQEIEELVQVQTN